MAISPEKSVNVPAHQAEPGEVVSLLELIPSSAETITNGANVHSTAVETADPSVFAIRREVDDAYKAAANPKTSPVISLTSAEAPTRPMPTSQAEKAKNPHFKIRSATEADIDAIVDVDIRSFESVYSDYGQDKQKLHEDLRGKFLGRLRKVGGEWMPVLENNGEIVGFMTCCPTSKTPEEFKSWEDTTDNGTLDSTYDPDGKNVYVVTLSVLPEGSAGKDMLFTHQIGKMLREGYSLGFFESRLPGLRDWIMANKCHDSEGIMDRLTDKQKDAYANEYFDSTIEIDGKEARRDKLIRLYERVGCKPLRVVPDAYRDKPSMDYGVVCVFDGSSLFDGSTLPVKVPQNRMSRWIFGSLMQSVAHSPKLTRKLFG